MLYGSEIYLKVKVKKVVKLVTVYSNINVENSYKNRVWRVLKKDHIIFERFLMWEDQYDGDTGG